jgi:hypothetical protein
MFTSFDEKLIDFVPDKYNKLNFSNFFIPLLPFVIENKPKKINFF